MSGYAVGVQVRDGQVDAAVVASNGAVAKRLGTLSGACDLGLVELRIADLVGRLRSEFDVGGVGVATRSPTLNGPSGQRGAELWGHENILSSSLQARVGLPVIVETEATANCWGEYQFGAGRGLANVVTIGLGAAVEGAVIAGSTLMRGAADNFAHLRLVEDGHLCSCGLQGCWNRYVSSAALADAARAETLRDPEKCRLLLAMAEGDAERLVSQHVARR